MDVPPQRLRHGGSSSRSDADSADLRLRLRARLRRRDLDREISAGASLNDNPLRALRARQLATRSERRAIASLLGEHPRCRRRMRSRPRDPSDARPSRGAGRAISDRSAHRAVARRSSARFPWYRTRPAAHRRPHWPAGTLPSRPDSRSGDRRHNPRTLTAFGITTATRSSGEPGSPVGALLPAAIVVFIDPHERRQCSRARAGGEQRPEAPLSPRSVWEVAAGLRQPRWSATRSPARVFHGAVAADRLAANAVRLDGFEKHEETAAVRTSAIGITSEASAGP